MVPAKALIADEVVRSCASWLACTSAKPEAEARVTKSRSLIGACFAAIAPPQASAANRANAALLCIACMIVASSVDGRIRLEVRTSSRRRCCVHAA
jgi:hypothetical protein